MNKTELIAVAAENAGMSKKDAVKQTAKDLKLPKNEVYDLALKMEE